MVRLRYFCSHSDVGGFSVPENTFSKDRVILHGRPLLLVQRSRLVEDLVRDGDLSDVVHGARVKNAIDVIRGHPDAAGNLRSEVTDSPYVCAGVFIAKLRSTGQQIDGLMIAFTQLCDFFCYLSFEGFRHVRAEGFCTLSAECGFKP